jgi:hypothetical protein
MDWLRPGDVPETDAERAVVSLHILVDLIGCLWKYPSHYQAKDVVKFSTF